MEPNKTNFSMTWIIGGIVVVVAIIVGIYFLTQKSVNNLPNNETETVDLNTTGTTPAGSSALPEDRVSVNAEMKGLDVVNLQTFPYKVQAKVSVDLPNSCSTAAGSVTQSGKVFTVTTTASQPKDAMCAQVITPATITVDVPVAGLAAGTYTVKYGTFTKTFTLAQSNNVEYSSDK